MNLNNLITMKRYFLILLFTAILTNLAAQQYISCATARSLALALPAGETGTTLYCVTGYITSTNGIGNYGQQQFWMDDVPGTAQTFQCYYGNLPEGTTQALQVGERVTVMGYLKNYNNTIPEIMHGDILQDWSFKSSTNVLTISFMGDMPNSSSQNLPPWHSYSSSIRSIHILPSVTSIGNNAFKDCYHLKVINIPNSITSIGEGAFKFCFDLDSINIPNSVINIGDSAFFRAGLTSVTIPSNITNLGANVFDWCESLSSVFVLNGVKSISKMSFKDCSNLSYINLPNTVSSIEDSAFYNCSALSSISVPDSVTSIGAGAFFGCSGLSSVIIPDSLLYIGENAFYNCSGLTSITLPSKLSVIEEKTFCRCSGLTSITIPNNVTTIGRRAFHKCSNLSFVTIGSSVTYIDYQAFYNCDSLSLINVKSCVPPSFSEYPAFEKTVDVIVPNGSISNYSHYLTDYWSWCSLREEFSFNVESVDELIGQVTVTQDCDSAYLIATPVEGYHFTQWSDGNTENPRTIIVTQDSTLMASFAINQYLLTLTVNDDMMGIVTGGGLYEHKSMVECKATPVSGYEFVKWSDGSTYNPYSFIIKEDMELQAEIREIQSTLVNDINLSSSFQKIFRDGHIYIIRDGKCFTLQGIEVK